MFSTYLKIKRASTDAVPAVIDSKSLRFDIPKDAIRLSKNIQAIQGISALADKAGIPKHSPIELQLFSQLIAKGTYDKDYLNSLLGLNTGSKIGIWDLHPNIKGILEPRTLLHEYGHTIDDARHPVRTFLDRLGLPMYDLLHPQYEQGADDEARRILNTVPDPKERAELVRAYNRDAHGNLMHAKINRPRDIGRGIGKMTAGFGSGAVGGFLGYQLGDTLYRHNHPETNNKDYTPTDSHRIANIYTSAVGTGVGYSLGNPLLGDKGGQIGEAIGSRFVDKAKNRQVHNIMDRTFRGIGGQDMLYMLNTLPKYAKL